MLEVRVPASGLGYKTCFDIFEIDQALPKGFEKEKNIYIDQRIE